MGLDMYLYKVTYIGANWDHRDIQGTIELTEPIWDAGKKLGRRKINIDLKKVSEIKELVIDWVKANAIHKWFVDNTQDGIDECKESEVTVEQLRKLDKLCKAVLNDHDKAENLLPTQSGFFFGDTSYNEDYFQDLKDTVKALKPLITQEIKDNCRISFIYRASW